VEIAHYRAGVAVSEDRLEKLAYAVKRRELDSAVRTLHKKLELMSRVGRSAGSKQMQGRAAVIKESIKELQRLGRSWPALKDPNATQQKQLKQIFSDLNTALILSDFAPPLSLKFPITLGGTPGKDVGASFYGEFEKAGNKNPTSPDLLSLFPPEILDSIPEKINNISIIPTVRPHDWFGRTWNPHRADSLSYLSINPWDDPLAAFFALQTECDERILEIVAKSNRSKAESDKLRAVMGDTYTSYYNDWQDRIKEAKRQRDQEIQRQKSEAMRKAAQEYNNLMRENTYRRETRRVEIP
jgi:hypothetical protein